MTEKKKDVFYRLGEGIGWILFILLAYFIFKTIAWGYNSVSPFHGFTNKSELITSLSKAISNKADLESVKTIFSNRNIDRAFTTRIFTNNKDSYIEPISLDIVLSDMKAEYFLNAPQNSEYLPLLNQIIKEHKEVNPFDKLLIHQKDRFDNIRIKLDDKYSAIENDVVKISDELNKQNELVREYLSDSTISLVISITGLCFALVISLIQIFQSKKKQK